LLISNKLMPAFTNAHKKKFKEKTTKNAQKRKYSKFAYFLAIAFFRGICLSLISTILRLITIKFETLKPPNVKV
jgi:hypothetical protein